MSQLQVFKKIHNFRKIHQQRNTPYKYCQFCGGVKKGKLKVLFHVNIHMIYVPNDTKCNIKKPLLTCIMD